MKFRIRTEMSRLKKKLLLYFLLISIVSISVSAEIIFEVSSAKLENEIRDNVYSQIEKNMPNISIAEMDEKLDTDTIFNPIYDLRNRMILFLLVVTACIISSFVLFTKDIVSPMDGIVDATKQIVDGDLTITVPVMTEDEIGLIASLINDMNDNLTNMINQVKLEASRYKNNLTAANNRINELVDESRINDIITNKKMHVSDFRKMMDIGKDVFDMLNTIMTDLGELQTYLNMYKTYRLHSDVTQKEIDDAVDGYDDIV